MSSQYLKWMNASRGIIAPPAPVAEYSQHLKGVDTDFAHLIGGEILSCKSSDDGKHLYFTGIASEELLDLDNEIVLVDGIRLDKRVPLMASHDKRRLPVGRVTNGWVDDSGKNKKYMIEAMVSNAHPEIQTKIKESLLELSIGFIPDPEGAAPYTKDFDDVENVKVYPSVLVFETSLVWKGANPGTAILSSIYKDTKLQWISEKIAPDVSRIVPFLEDGMECPTGVKVSDWALCKSVINKARTGKTLTQGEEFLLEMLTDEGVKISPMTRKATGDDPAMYAYELATLKHAILHGHGMTTGHKKLINGIDALLNNKPSGMGADMDYILQCWVQENKTLINKMLESQGIEVTWKYKWIHP